MLHCIAQAFFYLVQCMKNQLLAFFVLVKHSTQRLAFAKGFSLCDRHCFGCSAQRLHLVPYEILKEPEGLSPCQKGIF